jgi:quercetin dioxygenase-like cupin family protein
MRFVTRPLAVFSATIILLAATGSNSLAQKRTPLQTIDFPTGYETVRVIAELEPGSCTGRHTHPGAESAYALEGAGVAKFDGKPDLVLKAGQPLQFAPGEVHNVCNVSGELFKALAHYIVEKGKLRGTAAAGGIALINSMGNLSGYLGPPMVGYLKDQTGSFQSGLIMLGGFLGMAGLLAFALTRNRLPELSL